MQTRYSKDHEWVTLDGDLAKVGITDFAQKALGDVVFVELPDIGRSVKPGEEVAVVESVKAASEVYAPLSGEISAINTALEDDPALVNTNPEDTGWFFQVQVSDLSEWEALMDTQTYQDFCQEQGGGV